MAEIDDKRKKEKKYMQKKEKNTMAKGIKSVLDIVLKTEANTASCFIMYEPKAPKDLQRFTRNK